MLDNLVDEFKQSTSSEALTEVTCAACGGMVFGEDADTVSVEDISLGPLARPDKNTYYAEENRSWLDPTVSPPDINWPCCSWPDALLDPSGISNQEDGGQDIHLCPSCSSALHNEKVPPLCLANKTYLGKVPPELEQLTAIEESMIALCRAKCTIVTLREENDGDNATTVNKQRGYKGNIIMYPQPVGSVAQLLPPSIEDIVAPICVIFVGHKAPTKEWLQTNAKPLAVNGGRVRRALLWLKKHNPLYKDVQINWDVLDVLRAGTGLPFHVEHMQPEDSANSLTARYDTDPSIETQAEITFENVVITDVEGSAPSNQLRAAAVRHVKEKGKDFVAISHSGSPERDFNNPSFFPKVFPTLFPYGLGGLEDSGRAQKLSMQTHVRHLMNLGDRRFQTHPSFMFTAFNIMQRRRVLLESHLRVKRDSFDKIIDLYTDIRASDIEAVTDRVARGDYSTAFNEGEKNVLKLLREVEVVNTPVQGSAASRKSMRNEIRGMMHTHGLPAFYLTINPSDCHNPIVKFLSGDTFDLNHMGHDDTVQYWTQSKLVASNPALAAKFFNLFIKSFIKCLLGYDGPDNARDGVLGTVKAYYGCVEAQGRGSLHFHMVVWVEGVLHSDALKTEINSRPGAHFQKRVVEYLESLISTSIPDEEGGSRRKVDGINPTYTRGPWSQPNERVDEFQTRELKDFAELVRACQLHSHSPTCYKYCKRGDKKKCRFMLDASAVVHETIVDPETGAINLRKLDGLVNNFNETILRALRCNMDIKFIPSGEDAKAVLYYITDYIAKAQLPVHVAYATLEVAVKQLDKIDHCDTPIDLAAKQLL